jgi:hypothetical protein
MPNQTVSIKSIDHAEINIKTKDASYHLSGWSVVLVCVVAVTLGLFYIDRKFPDVKHVTKRFIKHKVFRRK